MTNPRVPAGAASAVAELLGGSRAAGDEQAELVASLTSSVVVEVREVGTLGHTVRPISGVLARVARRSTLNHTTVYDSRTINYYYALNHCQVPAHNIN